MMTGVARPSPRRRRHTSKLKKRGIYVRYFNKPRIDNYLRISVGTDDQMKKLFYALEEIIDGCNSGLKA